MEFETVIYPQEPLIQNHNKLASFHPNNQNICYDMNDYWDTISSPEYCICGGIGGDHLISGELLTESQVAATKVGRKKRKRSKSGKNKEELENQRMCHITVERNRRKQMNEYLGVIRSLMPSSYVQRGDQASTIGGAINFVKELEHQLQILEAQKSQQQCQQEANNNRYSDLPLPFGDFFSVPQYSTRLANDVDGGVSMVVDHRPPAMGEIEVTMVENYANLKILTKKRHRQLVKMVAWLQCLWLTLLHLNVTTVDHMVLYSLGVKLEDGCQMRTVDEIADAVNCMLSRIEEAAI